MMTFIVDNKGQDKCFSISREKKIKEMITLFGKSLDQNIFENSFNKSLMKILYFLHFSPNFRQNNKGNN